MNSAIRQLRTDSLIQTMSKSFPLPGIGRAGGTAGSSPASTDPGANLATEGPCSHLTKGRRSYALISVEQALDLLGIGRPGQRQHQQDAGLLRVQRIGDDEVEFVV